MKAIILSPGPSLAQYAPQPADIVLAVNRAATLHHCDYWIAGDLPLVLKTQERVIGFPKLVTVQATIDSLRDRMQTWRGESTAWDSLRDTFLVPAIVNWPWSSFTSAVVYAASLGATTIEVYGADWDGKADFDGVMAGQNRSPERWEYERQLFNSLVKVLGDRGATVFRHVMQPA